MVSPLARQLAPLVPQQRYALAGFARWALPTPSTGSTALTHSVQLPVQLPRNMRATRLPHGDRGMPEVDLWCLTHTTAALKHSVLAGPAVALDSLDASARCLTAWPRSNASTGFLGPASCRPAARSVATATTDLADIVQTRWRQFGTKAANTATSCIRPYDARSRDEHAACWPVGRSLAGADGWSDGAQVDLESANRRCRGKVSEFAEAAATSRAHHLGPLSGAKKEKFLKNIPEKPSAVANPLEINWGPR